MSRVKQLADEEADRVEAEDDLVAPPEDDDEAEAEREEEDQPGTGLEPPSMEEALAMLEAERERHRVALETILGDDFAHFQECAVCDSMGYRVLGDVPFDPSLRRCQICQGHGVLQTHSRKPGAELRDCMECQGNGFVVYVEAPQHPPMPPQPLIMYDPMTGQPVDVSRTSVPALPDGTWAPGYTPPARPGWGGNPGQ